MNETVFLAALTGCGFAVMAVCALSVGRSLAAIEKELDLHFKYMKSLDRQGELELEPHRMHLGLTEKQEQP